MIKLIASDLDGTILRHGIHTLDPEYITVIRKLKEKGIYFVPASGRPYSNLVDLFKEVKDEVFFISENGGMYTYDGEIHIPITHTKETIAEIAKVVREDPNCELTYSSSHTTYIEAKGEDFFHHLSNNAKFEITVVDDLTTIQAPAIKLAIYNPHGGSVQSEEKYQTLFKDKINVVTSGNFWIDFMPFDVNKGAALQHLIDELHIKPEECIAFGDQWNDIEMLKLVGTSYAMVDAAPGISDHCTHTTDNVLQELKKLLAMLDA